MKCFVLVCSAGRFSVRCSKDFIAATLNLPLTVVWWWKPRSIGHLVLYVLAQNAISSNSRFFCNIAISSSCVVHEWNAFLVMSWSQKTLYLASAYNNISRDVISDLRYLITRLVTLCVYLIFRSRSYEHVYSHKTPLNLAIESISGWVLSLIFALVSQKL